MLSLPIGSGPLSAKARTPTGIRVHPERLRELQALNASYGELVVRAQGLLSEHRLDALRVARMETELQEINARKGAIGTVALLEAGFDINAADYTIDEENGEVIALKDCRTEQGEPQRE